MCIRLLLADNRQVELAAVHILYSFLSGIDRHILGVTICKIRSREHTFNISRPLSAPPLFKNTD